MANRRPLVLVNGNVRELPNGDTLPDDATALTPADIGAQPVDADLTALGGLDSGTSGGVPATDGSGWIKKTYAQLKTALSLSKSDVGLGSVDNTADTAKPVSTAQQTALDGKASTSHNHDAAYSALGHSHSYAPTASPTFTGVATFERTVKGAYALGATLSGTVNINASNGDLQRGTATGAITIAEPTNGTDGQMILIEVTASGADRVVTVHTDITRYSGCAASITCLSGKKVLLGLMRSGADWYGTTLDRVP